jgi:hypothetical protein
MGCARILQGLPSTCLWGTNSATRSRRSPLVLVDEPAEDVAPPDHRTTDLFDESGAIKWIEIKGSMRSASVVMLCERDEDALQVTPAEDKDVVEALSPSGADPALRERVRPRRTDGCLHHSESFRAKDLIEWARELRVSIPDRIRLPSSLPAIARFRACCVTQAERVGLSCQLHGPVWWRARRRTERRASLGTRFRS